MFFFSPIFFFHCIFYSLCSHFLWLCTFDRCFSGWDIVYVPPYLFWYYSSYHYFSNSNLTDESKNVLLRNILTVPVFQASRHHKRFAVNLLNSTGSHFIVSWIPPLCVKKDELLKEATRALVNNFYHGFNNSSAREWRAEKTKYHWSIKCDII